MAAPSSTDGGTPHKDAVHACDNCHEAQSEALCPKPRSTEKKCLSLELDLAVPVHGGVSSADHTADIRPELVVSPMSDLAMNVSMCELSDGTPKRKLQLCLTPTPQGVTSATAGIRRICSYTDSPNLVEDSPTIQQMLQNRNPAVRRPMSLRRHQSMPVHFQGFSQEFDDHKENVKDVTSHSHGTGQAGAAADNHAFRVPRRPPTKRGLLLSQGSNQAAGRSAFSAESSGLAAGISGVTAGSSAADTDSLAVAAGGSLVLEGSSSVDAGSSGMAAANPAALPQAPPRICDVDNDDEFLELLVAKQDQLVAEEKVSSSLMSLINAPLIGSEGGHKSPGETPKGCERGQPRGLFRSPSAPKLTGLKRPECSTQRVSPLNKRRKSVCDDDAASVQRVRSPLYRSHSICESGFSHYLNAGGEAHNLIGDFSRPYCLPLVKGKHQDLKSITPDTLFDLLQGVYSGQVQHFDIIDCRYPYEYKGGHIKGAKNIYRKDEVLSELLHNPPCSDTTKHNILVFHCEFSSERAPKLSRFLRNKDRDAHKTCYPGLDYPEVYLLDGGYKAFYESHQSMCVPQGYTPMLHKDYGEELKKFRLRSKSWAGERRPVLRAGLTQRFNSVR